MPTIQELIINAQQSLVPYSETPRLDAELLLAFSCNLKKEDLITRSTEPIPLEQENTYKHLIKRRITHEPIAYIVGKKEFWGLEFQVNSSVLIPRPESEHLVEEGLKLLGSFSKPYKILDLGTGSGCLTVALAHALKKQGVTFDIIATDISIASLKLAQVNARSHEVEDNISFVLTNWCDALNLNQRHCNLIISNPPYIEEGDNNISPALHWEPSKALFAKEEGLSHIKVLLSTAPLLLKPGGNFLCEIGANQRAKIEKLIRYSPKLSHLSKKVSFLKDLANNDRILRVVS